MSTADTGNRIGPLPPVREEVRREEVRPAASAGVRQEVRTAEVVAGGSMAEAVAGIAGIVLAIVALAHVFPLYLGPIAAIVLGVGLVLEGGAVAARYGGVLESMGDTARSELEVGTGMSAEVLGGIAGIVLGILALIGIVPFALEGVTAIVFGATLLLGCAATAGLNQLVVWRYCGTMTAHEAVSRRVMSEAVTAAGGAQLLIGLGAVVLGILALVLTGTNVAAAEVLFLVAFLSVGCALLLSGAALSGKFLRLLNRRW